jgi:hypothetical protein
MSTGDYKGESIYPEQCNKQAKSKKNLSLTYSFSIFASVESQSNDE